jgi:hypothetical protein
LLARAFEVQRSSHMPKQVELEEVAHFLREIYHANVTHTDGAAANGDVEKVSEKTSNKGEEEAVHDDDIYQSKLPYRSDVLPLPLCFRKENTSIKFDVEQYPLYEQTRELLSRLKCGHFKQQHSLPEEEQLELFEVWKRDVHTYTIFHMCSLSLSLSHTHTTFHTSFFFL